MNSDRRANQVINWAPEGKRGRGRPRKNWMGTVREDLRCLEKTVEDATYGSHTNPLFFNFKVLKLEQLRLFQIGEFMYKYDRGLLPPVGYTRDSLILPQRFTPT